MRNKPAGAATHSASGLTARPLTTVLPTSSGIAWVPSGSTRSSQPANVDHTTPWTGTSPPLPASTSRTVTRAPRGLTCTIGSLPPQLVSQTTSAPTRMLPPAPMSSGSGTEAVTRLVVGSTRHSRSPASRSPTTHTPLGPTPTAAGRLPRSGILATTRLLSGSTRISMILPGVDVSAQHAVHTAPPPTATEAGTGPIGTVATTSLVCGSIRARPTPATAPQTAPPPTASPVTQACHGPVPAIVATTRLVFGSTLETVQSCAAQTAPRPTATASTGPPRSTLAATGACGEGKVGERSAGSPGGAVTGEVARLTSAPTTCPAMSSTPSSATTPATLLSRRRDSLGISGAQGCRDRAGPDGRTGSGGGGRRRPLRPGRALPLARAAAEDHRRADHQHDPDVGVEDGRAGRPVVLAQRLVEAGPGVVFDRLHDPAHLEVALGVAGVDDRQGDPGLALHVAVLLPGPGVGHADPPAVPPEPHGVGLHRAVGPDGGQVRDEGELEQVLEAGRDRHCLLVHDRPPVSGGWGSAGLVLVVLVLVVPAEHGVHVHLGAFSTAGEDNATPGADRDRARRGRIVGDAVQVHLVGGRREVEPVAAPGEIEVDLAGGRTDVDVLGGLLERHGHPAGAGARGKRLSEPPAARDRPGPAGEVHRAADALHRHGSSAAADGHGGAGGHLRAEDDRTAEADAWAPRVELQRVAPHCVLDPRLDQGVAPLPEREAVAAVAAHGRDRAGVGDQAMATSRRYGMCLCGPSPAREVLEVLQAGLRALVEQAKGQHVP